MKFFITYEQKFKIFTECDKVKSNETQMDIGKRMFRYGSAKN